MGFWSPLLGTGSLPQFTWMTRTIFNEAGLSVAVVISVQVREFHLALRVVLVRWWFAGRGAPGTVKCDPIQDLGEHGLSTELLGETGEPVAPTSMGTMGTFDPDRDPREIR